MSHAERHYVPAASHDFLLPLYDQTRGALVQQAAIPDGARVLDLGCGTGSLSVWIQRQHPRTQLTALDPDAKALARARRKAEAEGLAIRFDQGFGDALPYEGGAFDRVL